MKKIYILLALAVFSCKSSDDTKTIDSTIASADSVATATSTADSGAYCFMEAIGKDTTIVTFSVLDGKVEGEMRWLPYEKDGAVGTIKGTISGETITVDYDYVIEGSQQVEEKIFVLQGDKLLEKSGELEDKNGKLVMKDPAKATIGATLTKVNCLDISHD